MSRSPRVLVAVLLLSAAAACSEGDSAPASAPTVTEAPVTTVAPTATTTLPQPPVWQARAAAPTTRQEVASTVLDGRVWVIGGLTATGPSAVVESYDPVADQWAAGPVLPVAVHHAVATVYRGEIVVAGGFLAAASLYDRASDRVLALRSGGWVDLPRMRRPRGAAAVAAVGGSLVVTGGRDGAALIGPTEIFDGTVWRDGAPILTRRDHLSAVSDGRSVLTVGGRFLSPGAVSAAFERYDPSTDAWERLPAMPTARAGQGAALAGGRIVVAGGESATRVYPEVEAYDPAAQAWATLPPLPSPRHGLAVEAVGARLLALVGGTAVGVAPSARAEALSPLS